jgi:hypothetical protein
MVSLPPGYTREIAVFVDGKGRPLSYSELNFASTGRLSGQGENIFATLDSRGNVRGFRVRIESHLPDGVSLKPDSASFRRIREGMITTSSPRDPLDADAQRRVVELVKWLRNRCPA